MAKSNPTGERGRLTQYTRDLLEDLSLQRIAHGPTCLIHAVIRIVSLPVAPALRNRLPITLVVVCVRQMLWANGTRCLCRHQK